MNTIRQNARNEASGHTELLERALLPCLTESEETPPFQSAEISPSFQPRSGLRNEEIVRILSEQGFANPPSLIVKMLATRGFSTEAELNLFLEPTSFTFPAVDQIGGMRRSLDILAAAILDKTPVAIVCDYDVDGLTGGAQLYELLRRLDVPCTVHIPDRLTEGYGANARIVNEIKAAQYPTVVMIDLGTNNQKEISELHALGASVIVWDHHHPHGSEVLAAAVVNPHTSGAALQEMSPCGSGITFLALRALIAEEHLEDRIKSKDLLALAALGTVCDMVPLSAGNRSIVKQFLTETSALDHAGIAALLSAFRDKHSNPGRVSVEDITYYAGPAINSASRLGRQSLAWDLLTSFSQTNDGSAGTTAHALVTLNQERQAAQKNSLAACYQALALEPALGSSIVIAAPISSGLSGLCAQSLSGRYARPTIIFTEEDGLLRGSARSGDTRYDLQQLLDECKEYTLRYGGHRAAAGAVIEPSQLRNFSTAFEAAVRRVGVVPTREVRSDVVASLVELTNDAVAYMQNVFEPSGMGARTPVVTLKSVAVTGVTAHRGGVTVYDLEQNGSRGRAISFGTIPLPNLSRGQVVDMIVSPRLDRYRNNTRVALHIEGITRQEKQSIQRPTVVTSPTAQQKLFSPHDLSPSVRQEPVEQIKKASKKAAPSSQWNQKRLSFDQASDDTPPVYSVSADGKFHRLDKTFISTPPKTFTELSVQHNLSLLRTEALRDETSQLRFLHYALATNESIVCKTQTGDGKTLMALALASQYLQRQEKVLYLIPRVDLMIQALDECEKFLNFPKSSVPILSGEISPDKRATILSNHDTKLVLSTPETVLKDIQRGTLSLKDFSLAIIDEAHQINGRSAVALVTDAIVEGNIRRLALSGSLASTRSELTRRMVRLGNPLLFELESKPRERSTVFSEIERAPLETTVTTLHQLGGSAAQRIAEGTLSFEELHSVNDWALRIALAPSSLRNVSADDIQDRMALIRAEAKACTHIDDITLLGNVISQGAELSHIRLLSERYERYGKAMMLLKAYDAGSEILLEPLVHQLGMGRIAAQTPQYIKRLYRKDGALYNLLEQNTYGDTLNALLDPYSGKLHAFLSEHQEQLSSIRSAKYIQRWIRDRLESELSILSDIDHPKLEALLEIGRNPQSKKVIVFTGLVDHARFVARALQHQGVKADWYVGKGATAGASDREHRSTALKQLRSGETTMLIATSVANLGLDVEGLTDIVHWQPHDETTTVNMQRNGRVSRLTSEATGTVTNLVLKGSDDERRYQTLERSADAISRWFTD